MTKAKQKPELIFEVGYSVSELKEKLTSDELTFRIRYPEFDEKGQLVLPVGIGGSEGIQEVRMPISADYLREMLEQNDKSDNDA